MPTKYSDEQRVKALELKDAGKTADQVSKILNIPKNTIYGWTKDSGRQEFSETMQAIRGTTARRKAVSAPVDSLAEENARLRRENEKLWALLEEYRGR